MLQSMGVTGSDTTELLDNKPDQGAEPPARSKSVQSSFCQHQSVVPLHPMSRKVKALLDRWEG